MALSENEFPIRSWQELRDLGYEVGWGSNFNPSGYRAIYDVISNGRTLAIVSMARIDRINREWRDFESVYDAVCAFPMETWGADVYPSTRDPNVESHDDDDARALAWLRSLPGVTVIDLNNDKYMGSGVVMHMAKWPSGRETW
jgi:hypothetical protein